MLRGDETVTYSETTEVETMRTVTVDGVTTSEYSSSRTVTGTKLVMNAVGAADLKNVEWVGKQDPYLQFSLDVKNPKSFVKTRTDSKGGVTPNWSQTFEIPLAGEPLLFVEIMNKETTVDEVVGFAAIPINQLVHAQSGMFNGYFPVYSTKCEAGRIHLQFYTQGFPNSPTGNVIFQGEPVLGQSFVHEEHIKRVKNIHRKDVASGVGVAILGAAAVAGLGYLGHQVYEHEKDKKERQHQAEEEEQHRREEEEEQRRRQEEEEQRRRQEEEEQRRRQEEEEQRRRQESEHHRHEKRDEEEHHRHEKREEEEHHHRKEKHHGECHGESRHRGGDEWDPVGTYAAGDRVYYKGHEYLCLQGHTSNPTWKPTDAVSLWERA